MTTGIKVIWPDDEGGVDEIEYFYGIDIDDLGNIPAFTSVPVVWPNYEGGIAEEYVVRTRCDRIGRREARLAVTYGRRDNRRLVESYPGFRFWGTNTIVLRRGKRTGTCEWRLEGEHECEHIGWEAFDVEGQRGRRRKASEALERDAQFRTTVLAFDGHRCVLTEETTSAALDAAHLLPARQGMNDAPYNGITLRCDLHRLFDACLGACQ